MSMLHVPHNKPVKYHVIRVTKSQHNRKLFAVAHVTDWIPYAGILSLEILEDRFKSHTAALKAAAKLEQKARKETRSLVNETSPEWQLREAYDEE